MQKTLLFLTSFLLLKASNLTNGALLFQGNCTACHYQRVEKSAPSMMQIQQRYKKAFPDKKEFMKHLSNWVYNPNAEQSIMQDVIAKYNLMPQLAYDKDVLKEIAAYIYDMDN